jgi:hypothetical protein
MRSGLQNAGPESDNQAHNTHDHLGRTSPGEKFFVKKKLIGVAFILVSSRKMRKVKNFFLVWIYLTPFFVFQYTGGRHNIQHNDTFHNDTQHNGLIYYTQHNGLIFDTQHKDTQRNGLNCDTQHKWHSA